MVKPVILSVSDLKVHFPVKGQGGLFPKTHLLKAVAGDPALPSYVLPYGRLMLGQICDLTDRRHEAKAFYRQAEESAGGYDGVRRAAEHFLKNPYTRGE